MTTSAFIRGMESAGYRCAVVPIARLDDLERELYELGQGEFKTGIIDWRAQGLDEYKPKDLPFEPRSIAIIARKSPAMRMRIETGERALDILVPPGYAGGDACELNFEQDARALLASEGLHASPAGGLPCKLLAVRSGLGRYGRNNICYVDGLGSYLDLMALYTDLTCDEDPWCEVRLLDSCAKCTACVAACPTQAIAEDRAVINADRCLCALNERLEPFPDWLALDVHHTLVGCLRCQACCPADADQRDNFTDAGVLSEADVNRILALKEGEPLPDDLLARADAIGMGHYSAQLRRNLKALVQAH